MGLIGNVMKSRYLMNVDADNGEHEDDDAEEDDEDEEMTDGLVPGVAAKKRKVATSSVPGEDRTFEVRRWVAVPAEKADKMTEPKYLADRRPGMPSLYTNAAVLKQASGYGAPITAVNEHSGIDLGDGSGLGSALGGAAAAPGEATPVRKNMPPKRKKKKLGGPGRRKAVPVEATEQAATVEPKEGEIAEKQLADGEKKEGDIDGDGDEGSGDESEGEGSEEGEVNEEPAPPAPVPEVTVEAVMEDAPVAPTVPSVSPAPDTPPASAVEEKPVEAVTEEVSVAPASSPGKQEGETDLLGGLEAALEKQDS